MPFQSFRLVNVPHLAYIEVEDLRFAERPGGAYSGTKSGEKVKNACDETVNRDEEIFQTFCKGIGLLSFYLTYLSIIVDKAHV